MNLSEWWFQAIKDGWPWCPSTSTLLHVPCWHVLLLALTLSSIAVYVDRGIILSYLHIQLYVNMTIHAYAHTLTQWYSHVQEAWLRKRDRRQTLLKNMCFYIQPIEDMSDKLVQMVWRINSGRWTNMWEWSFCLGAWARHFDCVQMEKQSSLLGKWSSERYFGQWQCYLKQAVKTLFYILALTGNQWRMSKSHSCIIKARDLITHSIHFLSQYLYSTVQ